MTTAQFTSRYEHHGLGVCDLNLAGQGWYQHSEASDSIMLRVRLTQTRLMRVDRDAMEDAKIDTGSPISIIDFDLFKELGFRLPSGAKAGSVPFVGSVRGGQRLDGYQPIPLWVGLPTDWCRHVRLSLPRPKVQFIVARNIRRSRGRPKLLLGLDFLAYFTVLLHDQRIVMMAK